MTGSPIPTTKVRKRLSGDERRTSLLDAAITIIVELGIEAVTMERVAERVEVNKALGYRYFANREALLVALYNRENQRLDDQVETALLGRHTFQEKLHAIVRTYMEELDSGGLAVTGALAGGIGGPAVKQRQDARVVATLQFFVDLVTPEFDVNVNQAFAVAAVFSSGLGGLIQLGQVTGTDKAQLEGDFVAMAIGALTALATTAQERRPTGA